MIKYQILNFSNLRYLEFFTAFAKHLQKFLKIFLHCNFTTYKFLDYQILSQNKDLKFKIYRLKLFANFILGLIVYIKKLPEK